MSFDGHHANVLDRENPGMSGEIRIRS